MTISSHFTNLVIHPYVSNFRLTLSDSGVSLELLHTIFLWSIPVIFVLVAVTGPMWVLLSNKKLKKMVRPSTKISPGDLPESFDLKYTDSKFSMELQIPEVLLASLSSQITNAAPSSTQERRMVDLDSTLMKIENEVDNPSQSFCGICLETKESWEMFTNDSCNHSFCYECTSKHIVAKIQYNLKMISCPGADCKDTLDFNICRLMIPKDVLAKWDEFLCQSWIPNSQKLYCPFRDCSVLLINDSGAVTEKIMCPVCQRSFCALCLVPWHSEFTCKKFQKLNAKKGGKDDMLKLLGKKKGWQKCPSCKMRVEKTGGCLHITCRCTYEFCYRCGSKWIGLHSCKIINFWNRLKTGCLHSR